MRGVITKKPNGEDSETVDLSNLRKAGFFVIAELLTHRHGERSHARSEPRPGCQPKVGADKTRCGLYATGWWGADRVIASRLDIKKGRTTEVELPLVLLPLSVSKDRLTMLY